MKFIVEHDERGTIKAIGAMSRRTDEKVTMELRPRPGHKIAVIDVSEITDPQDHAAIVALKRDHRVDEREGSPKLVRRSTA